MNHQRNAYMIYLVNAISAITSPCMGCRVGVVSLAVCTNILSTFPAGYEELMRRLFLLRLHHQTTRRIIIILIVVKGS